MTESDPAAAETDANADKKNTDPRTPRSIRFSDSEWARVEQAANERGMTAAVFVRHAAMSLADGKFIAGTAAFTPGHVELLERIFRTTYILATLKRDEITRQGRSGEMDDMVQAAREMQASLLNDTLEIPGNVDS